VKFATIPDMIESHKHETFGSSDVMAEQKVFEKLSSDTEKERINPKDFRGIKIKTQNGSVLLFTDEEIDRDIAAVETQTSRHATEAVSLTNEQREIAVHANFVESVIPAAVRDFEWLGKKVKTILPSAYDDIFNSTDLIIQMFPKEVAETLEDMRCIGFSIDLTISKAEAREKFGKTLSDLAVKGLPKVKYFKSDVLVKDGDEVINREVKLKNLKMPKIIVSCNGDVLEDAKEKFMSWADDESEENKSALTNCRLRYVVIQEIFMQLSFITSLAKEANFQDVHSVYEKSLDVFTKLMAEEGITTENIGEKSGVDSSFVKEFSKTMSIKQAAQALAHLRTAGQR